MVDRRFSVQVSFSFLSLPSQNLVSPAPTHHSPFPSLNLLSVSSLVLKECELVVAYRNVLTGCSMNPRFWSSTLGPWKSLGNPKWRNSRASCPFPCLLHFSLYPENSISMVCMKVLVARLYPILCDPMDSSSPGSSVHGILQARILEWVVILFSRISSWLRDQNWVLCIAARFFTATKEAPWFVLRGTFKNSI